RPTCPGGYSAGTRRIDRCPACSRRARWPGSAAGACTATGPWKGRSSAAACSADARPAGPWLARPAADWSAEQAPQQLVDGVGAALHRRLLVLRPGDDQRHLVDRGEQHVGERADQFRSHLALLGDGLEYRPDPAEGMVLLHGPPPLPAEHRRRVDQ